MRTSGLLLAVLALTAATAAAQQELPPSAHEGPMQIKSAPLTPEQLAEMLETCGLPRPAQFYLGVLDQMASAVSEPAEAQD